MKDPNLRQLYSPFFFLYVLGIDDSFESLYKYEQYLSFYRPKTIAFELSEREFDQKYDKIVRSANFKQIMKRIAIDIKMKNTDELSNSGALVRVFADGTDALVHFFTIATPRSAKLCSSRRRGPKKLSTSKN